MKTCFLLPLLLVFFPLQLVAQKIDNLASFRDFKTDRYFRFNYDNDVFYSKDEDYTQGYNFELVLPALRHNPVNFLFVKPHNSAIRYGVATEHIGYTPYNIKASAIQYGDRPYACALMLKSFMIATDTIRRSRLVSSLSLGIVGPDALGEDMQIAFHKGLGNTIPQGWHNQIRNDVVINYEIGYEKQLIRTSWFSLQSNTSIKLGTLFTNASLGFNTTIGKHNAAFDESGHKNRWSIYGFLQPLVNIIGYDATLQGGIFNRSSQYTIPDSDLKRLTGQINYGIVFQRSSFYFEYTITSITREFATGPASGWGGFKLGFGL